MRLDTDSINYEAVSFKQFKNKLRADVHPHGILNPKKDFSKSLKVLKLIIVKNYTAIKMLLKA